jgi:6-phosphogluconolactonase
MNPKIQIFKDLHALSDFAAQLFVSAATQAIAERGRFLGALSGGNAPKPLYQLLASEAYRGQIEWKRVHIFWGDERCVPRDNPENNYFQASELLLSKVAIPEENIHRVESESSPAEAARDYANALKSFAEASLEYPRFDFVLLGMGDDGHTASLFPNSPTDVSSPVIAVTANYQDRPANRVTLTPLVFNAARQIIFLVSGGSKAETLAKILNGEYRPSLLPAQRIRPTEGELIWLIDETAASKL